jgi:type I restriction enzyme, S subunit
MREANILYLVVSKFCDVDLHPDRVLAHSFPAAINTRAVTINQDMKALRCVRALNPYFLRAYFRGYEEHIVSLTDSSAHGTRKLEAETLGRLEVLVPPSAEQL